MKLATNWMTRLYQNGAEPVNFATEQSSRVDHLLGHIESRDNSNSMRYHAANHRGIHCQGTHTSEDHHLSVSVPPVFDSGHIGLLPPLEQAQMTTYHHRPHSYKKNMQFLLPSQQSAFNTAQQRQQWPLPPKPTLPMTSHCSMPATTSSTSTRKSPISSTTSHMYVCCHHIPTATASLLPHTTTANQRERETIIKFLKEEHTHIKTLRQLLEMANDNNTELHLLFEDSPVNTDINWGELNWGLTPQWEQLPPQDE